MPELTLNTTITINKSTLNDLITRLGESGYETIGPQINEFSLVVEPISSIDDLPYGYSSIQETGYHRIQANTNTNYFNHTPGQDSWKKYLFPPRSCLFECAQENGSWHTTTPQDTPPKTAYIGVRPCDLAAISIQDRVFIRPDFTDPIYHQRRQNLFIVNVNCLHPSDTCFCSSMGTGPKADTGFDLSLTELDDVFLVEIGSDAGISFLQDLPWEPAGSYHLQSAQDGFSQAAGKMKRKIEYLDMLPDLLLNNLDHKLWQAVGERCLSCSNCTLVCPTCFCWDTEDHTSLSGQKTTRLRVWDSCFNLSHSYHSGGHTRSMAKARYRQWLTHKMSTWTKQFDTFGCTGCGRCIVWCPAKIDLTAEIQKLQEAVI